MRMIGSALIGFALALAGSSYAREANRPYKQLPDKEIDKKIRSLDVDAISEAGEGKRAASKAALEEVVGAQDWTDADKKKYDNGNGKPNERLKEQVIAQRSFARHTARLALAKLGDKKYLKEFADDLKSPNDMKVAGAISSLGSIKDRRAVKHLIPFLDKDVVPKFKPGKRGPAAFSELAEQALESILPEVREEFRKQNPGRRFYFKEEWKAWWAKNKDNYKEGLE